MVILCLLIGYFLGMASAIIQIVRMENKHNKKIQEILDKK
jgi:hypothetical protein